MVALSDGDLTMLADSGQIEQVLMNLATNARNAMPRTVRVFGHRSDRRRGYDYEIHGEPGTGYAFSFLMS
jgi:signal transduction histidine kinase